MTNKQKIDWIESVANDNGWAVHLYQSNDGRETLEFNQSTPVGQDFSFAIDIQKDADGEINIDETISQVYEYWESFDPDYEAYLWLGDDGHGKNGAPHSMRAVLDDMEDAEDMINGLYQTLRYAWTNYDESNDDNEEDKDGGR